MESFKRLTSIELCMNHRKEVDIEDVSKRYSTRKLISAGDADAKVTTIDVHATGTGTNFVYIQFNVFGEQYYTKFKFSSDGRSFIQSKYVSFMSELFPEKQIQQYIRSNKLLENKTFKIIFNGDSKNFELDSTSTVSYPIKSGEYTIDEREDSEVTDSVQLDPKMVQLYNVYPQEDVIDTGWRHEITTVEATGEESFKIDIPICNMKLTYEFDLPCVDELDTSKTATFIENTAGGKLKLLEGETVHIIHEKEVKSFNKRKINKELQWIQKDTTDNWCLVTRDQFECVSQNIYADDDNSSSYL